MPGGKMSSRAFVFLSATPESTRCPLKNSYFFGAAGVAATCLAMIRSLILAYVAAGIIYFLVRSVFLA